MFFPHRCIVCEKTYWSKLLVSPAFGQHKEEHKQRGEYPQSQESLLDPAVTELLYGGPVPS